MINITNKYDCCGCTACANVCKNQAITMIPDALGFSYPKVDLNVCTNCGLCDKVCSFNDNYDVSLNFTEPIAFGARHKDINEVMRSRSGAVFVAISDNIIEQGGIIYGVGFAEHFRVTHKRATTMTERDEFRGSKYVQSDLSNVFAQVKKDLTEGNVVLFIGTGCQCSGLNAFIGKKLRKKLIIADIACHGVPSPKYWQDYIFYMEARWGKLIKINFRDKEKYGWTAHHETLIFENGHIEYPQKSFYDSIVFRPSCYTCHFCNTKRPSDITLADYWGWEKQNTTVNQDDKGVSLVLINTEKGLSLWQNVKEKLNFFEADKETYLQPNLKAPTKEHPKRKKWEEDYIKYGFNYVYCHNYNIPSMWSRIKNKIKRYL